MDREKITRTLEGYARANAVSVAERIVWLAQLSPTEARSISKDLQESWEKRNFMQGETEAPWSQHVDSLLFLRKVFLQLAQHQGLV